MTAKPSSPEPSSTESAGDLNLVGAIFIAAAGMVGVCLTVVGVFQAVVHLGRVETLADELVAVVAAVFLLACGTAYFALRTPSAARRHRCARLADAVFLLALTLLGAICALVAYELI